MTATIHTCTAAQLIDKLAREQHRVPLVHADPAWPYGKAAPPGHGRIDGHYGGQSLEGIATDIDRSWDVAADDAYLAIWAVFPFMWAFIVATTRVQWRWEPLSGGCWGKTGRRGIGHHLLGDSEPWLLLRKGRPRAHEQRSNLTETIEAGAYWQRPRRGHSEKPFSVLLDIVDLGTAPGDGVLDLYAGESASLARACLHRRRRYDGAEVDPNRAASARARIGAWQGAA